MMTAGAVLISTSSVIANPAAPDKKDEAEFEQILDDLARELEYKGSPIKEAESVEAAQAAAAAQDRKVEVLQMRTETDTVYANPDGTLTRELASGPVRMVRDGKWVDVNVDFKTGKDGTVTTEAHPKQLRLAGRGGTLPKSIEGAARPRRRKRGTSSPSARVRISWRCSGRRLCRRRV
ncbi:hypothetical protein [Streptomyces sp. BA2]|uniref:hypothetical protein n=1 Tax=Streptomyces sp. BA2 TaxID=436595 RepID=UPI001F1E2664|nr:hypothetical protein [Streptomyces sp. BA2]